MILVPAIDILDGKAVRLKKGDYNEVTVYNEDAVAQARAFEQAGARRIHVVDLDGARDGVPTNLELVRRIVDEVGVEVEVGGGIRDFDTLELYMEAGVQRAVLGSALVKSPDFARAAAERYGKRIVAGIDALDGMVAVEGWCEDSEISAADLVEQLSEMGISNLVYTDISRDGMLEGIDAEAYGRITEAAPNVAVTASGGVATLDDLRALAAVEPPVEAAIAGRAIYEGAFTVEEGIAACEGAAC